MKKGISFSLQLLRMNRKHHADAIKRMERGNSTNINDKQLRKFFNKNLNNHKKYYDDLTLAINTLLGTKPKEKEESNNIVCIHPKDYTPIMRKQADGRMNRQKGKYKIIKKIK